MRPLGGWKIDALQVLALTLAVVVFAWPLRADDAIDAPKACPGCLDPDPTLCIGFTFTDDTEPEDTIDAGIAYLGLRDNAARLSNFDAPKVGDFGASLADVDHGWDYNRHGDYQRALTNCDAARLRMPDLDIAHLCLGWTHLAVGDAAAALVDFDRMASLRPAWWSPQAGRSQALFALGQFRGAATLSRERFPETASVATENERGIAVLWMLAALRRSGEADAEAEEIATETLDFDTWPGQIAGYLLKQRTEDDVKSAAATASSFSDTEPSPACRSAYFLGEGDLSDGSIHAALDRLRLATKICPLNSGERMMADIEVKRLNP